MTDKPDQRLSAESSRARRREIERRLRAELRRRGCRCRPRMRPDTDDDRGGWVRHEHACPFSDRLAAWASEGAIAQVVIDMEAER